MSLRLLQFGTHGQLGREMTERGEAAGLTILALSRRDIDLADTGAVRAAIAGAGPVDLVVNAAAYNDVDGAETDTEQALVVNAAAPAAMAEACRTRRLPFVHVSTDYIFGGAGEAPWRESDEPNPINAYGRSKLAGERAVLGVLSQAMVLRTSWLFSIHGSNFVKTMVRLARDRPEVRVVDDQRSRPTFAGDLADFILAAAPRLAARDAEAFGVFHFAGAEPVTRLQYAEAVVACLAPEARPGIVPVSSAAFAAPACRPANSVLDTGKSEAVFGFGSRSWRAALQDTVARLGREGAM